MVAFYWMGFIPPSIVIILSLIMNNGGGYGMVLLYSYIYLELIVLEIIYKQTDTLNQVQMHLRQF